MKAIAWATCVLGMVLLTGCLATEDSESGVGEEEEWVGVITTLVLETDTGLGEAIMVFTVAKDQYMMVVDPDATVIGIYKSDDGLTIRWKLGKTYRIIGARVTREESLDMMADMGWPSRKAILATYLELLPSEPDSGPSP